MIAKSWFGRCWQWKVVGGVAIVGALCVGVSDRVNAQIVPDNTLGAEGSVVTPNVNIQGIPSDQIDGGAPRGANLFHSFQEFNVGEGRGAYFANPIGIENILTRVTGGNASNILGRLGVLGGANLFLLNPNGIVFGPNASLDIQGSFVATTAERIQLGDSGYFSATQPQTSSLLSVSPGALFFSQVANQPGSIINRGNLSTGKHLTLSAGNLDLQGQLISGGDLTLQAQDTVKLRDTIASPVIVTSGRNLTIQGNQSVDILALNHPQSKIQSGGNLNLVSDGDISGDARFESGGSLSMLTLSGTPGNFVSWFDPIIQANGDVLFGNYTGVALKVEATGSIQSGDIRITGPDTAIPADDPDFATLTGRPSVILRAGLPSVNAPNVPQNAGGTEFTASLGLPPGISVGNISTSSGNGGNGGDIILSAAKGSINTGYLHSFSYSNEDGDTGQGGAINLTADNGSITTGDLNSYSYSRSGNTGQGGAINLTAANGSINTGDLNSFSYTESGNTGQGGAINLTADNGSITTGDLNSYSYSRSGNTGQGGAINLTADNGSITTGNLNSYSQSNNDGNAVQGGAISLTADNDINITGDLNSYSYSRSGNAGEGGAISLKSANDINITGDNLYSFSSSIDGNAGQGGAISLIARGGDISGKENSSTVLGSFSISERKTAGDGGNVALEAKNNVSNLEILTLSSSSQSGTVQVTGLGNLFLTNTNILTSKQVTVPDPLIKNRVITLNVGGEGQSGNVDVISSGNLTFNNSSIQSDTKGNDPAGNVTISSPGLVTFTNSRIISNTNSTGQAGSITLKAPEIQLDSSSSLFAQTSSSGAAGNLTLQPYDGGQALSVLFQEGAQISASTSSSGQGGNLFVTAPEAVTISGNGKLSVETSGAGAGGNLIIETQRLTIQDEAQISASTSSPDSSGIGGNLTVTATQSLDLNQASLLAQSIGAAPAGNVEINNTGNLTARDGTIATSTTRSAGGTVKITAGDIRLFGDSDIISNVASGADNGGNINLTADSILAFDDSDILAYARDGRGGDITLNTRAFFGENYRPAPKGTDPATLENNNRVDVNADATAAANSGAITRPDTSFIQNSLTELPENQIDTDSLLANSCIVRRNQPTRGTFFITGTGGLPERPGDAQMSTFPTVDIETLPSDSTPSNTNPNRPWQKGDPIVEPQGVYRLPNGKLVLSRECS